MLSREVLPSGVHLLRDARAEAHLWLESPTLLVWTLRGYGTKEIVVGVVEVLEQLLGSNSGVDIFNDTENMDAYDPEFRALLTKWSDRHKPQIRSLHILVRSKIVAMGVAVARLMLGGNLTMHSSRSAFEAAYTKAGGRVEQLKRLG